MVERKREREFSRSHQPTALLDRERRLLPLLPQPGRVLRHLQKPAGGDGAAVAAHHRCPRRPDVLQPDQHPRGVAFGTLWRAPDLLVQSVRRVRCYGYGRRRASGSARRGSREAGSGSHARGVPDDLAVRLGRTAGGAVRAPHRRVRHPHTSRGASTANASGSARGLQSISPDPLSTVERCRPRGCRVDGLLRRAAASASPEPFRKRISRRCTIHSSRLCPAW